MMSNQRNNGTSGRTIRLAILLPVLIIAAIAVGYDYLIARPAYRNSIKAVERLQSEQLSSPREPGKRIWKTEDDVHKALGRQPTKVDRQEFYVIETYHLPAGLLHAKDLYVLYKMRNGEPTLHDFREEKPFEPERLPKGPIPVQGFGIDRTEPKAGTSD